MYPFTNSINRDCAILIVAEESDVMVVKSPTGTTYTLRLVSIHFKMP